MPDTPNRADPPDAADPADPDIDPNDRYARERQALPNPNVGMSARLSQYGVEEQMSQSTVSFKRGDRGVPPFASC